MRRIHHVSEPQDRAGSGRRSRAWIGTALASAGVALLIFVGITLAADISAQQQVADLQSRRPVDTGGGPPTNVPALPTEAVPEPTATIAATAPPRFTSRDVPLLEMVEPTAEPDVFAVPVEPQSAPEVASTPQPTPTPSPALPAASHITVPAVGIDTDIVAVDPEYTQIGGQSVITWPVAEYAAGHHSTSANPGEGGNIVLAGHDDYRGEVFRGLHDIEVGHEIFVTAADRTYTYVVTEIFVRQYRDVPVEEQLLIGAWMAAMPEERLTLITCWPYGIDDHRVIVVAKPVLRASGP